MKKLTFKVVIVIMIILLLPIQAVQACCGFIIGRQLTKDGTTLLVGQKTTLTIQMAGNTTKTMLL